MKKHCVIILPAALLMLNSCAVLSKSQVKNINAFAVSAKKYSLFPGEIIRKRAELVLEEKLVGSINLLPEQINKNIVKAQKNDDVQQQIAEKVDISLQLIRQYASLLTKLSADHYVTDLSTNTDDLSDNLGNLVEVANTKLTNKIPTGVSQVISKAIFLVGEGLTKNKQAKILKEYISTGDTLIQVTVKNLEESLSSTLLNILTGDKQQYIDTYTSAVFNDAHKVNYTSLRQYLTALNNYDNLDQLRKKCIKAAEKLALAHSKLNSNIQAKSDMMEIYKETQDFIVSIQDLYKTFKELSSDKQS